MSVELALVLGGIGSTGTFAFLSETSKNPSSRKFYRGLMLLSSTAIPYTLMVIPTVPNEVYPIIFSLFLMSGTALMVYLYTAYVGAWFESAVAWLTGKKTIFTGE